MNSHKRPYREHLDASIAWLMKNWVASNPTPVWVRSHLIQRASIETNSLRGGRSLRWLVSKISAQYMRLAEFAAGLSLFAAGRSIIIIDERLIRIHPPSDAFIIHPPSDAFIQFSKQTTRYSIFPATRMINLI